MFKLHYILLILNCFHLGYFYFVKFPVGLLDTQKCEIEIFVNLKKTNDPQSHVLHAVQEVR
jgi:hypothetical protein